MSRNYVKLQKIDYNEEKFQESEAFFRYCVQNWLLQALREKDKLTISQYRYASQSLKQQMHQKIKRAAEKGCGK